MRHVIRAFMFYFAVLLVAGSVMLSPANAVGMIECADDLVVTLDAMDHDHSDMNAQASHEEETRNQHHEQTCGFHACIYGVDFHPVVEFGLTSATDAQAASIHQSLVDETIPEGLRRPPRLNNT